MVSCMCTGLHVSTRYSSQILMKLEFSRTMFEKASNIKFHENPFRGDLSCSMRTNRETDKHDEAHGRLS